MKDRGELSPQNPAIETLNAETATDWMSKVTILLGEPTYKIDKEYDPEAVDEVAVYHVKRHDIPEGTVLRDENTIGLSVFKNFENAHSYRINLRTQDDNGKAHSAYSNNIRRISIDPISECIAFYKDNSNEPYVTLYKDGKTFPLIPDLKTTD